MTDLTYTLIPNNSTDLTYTFGEPVIGSGNVAVDFTVEATASINNPCIYTFNTFPTNNITYVFSSGALIDVEATGTGSTLLAGGGSGQLGVEGSGSGNLNVSGQGLVTIEGVAGSGTGTFSPSLTGSGSVSTNITSTGNGTNQLYGSGSTTTELTGLGTSTVQPPVTGSGSAIVDFSSSGDGDLSEPIKGSGIPNTELSASGAAYQTPTSLTSSVTIGLSAQGESLTNQPIEASGSITTDIIVSGTGAIKIEGVGTSTLDVLTESTAWFAEYYGGGSATIDAPYNNGTGVGIVIPSQANQFGRSYFCQDGAHTQSTPITAHLPVSAISLKASLIKCANIESDNVIQNVCHSSPVIRIKGLVTCNSLSDADSVYGTECISSSDVIGVNGIECFRVSDISNTFMSKCMPVSDIVAVGAVKCVPLSVSENVSKTTCNTDIHAGESRTQRCMVHHETIYPLQGLSEFIPPVIIPPVIIPPIQPATITILEKDTYTMNNNVSAMLEDGTLIGIQNINLTHDANGHSWTGSATLINSDHRGLVKPKEDGSLVTVIITINQYKFYVLVEKITTSRGFNQDGMTLQFRGLSAELALPYTPNTDVAIDQVQTNQQIAEQLIPTGIGEWVVDWQLPVWNVPANTYEHRNTSPISALLQLVINCGGMLVPHRNEKRFTAKPRYPVLPWNFDTTPPDYEIPDNVIFTITEQPVAKSGANGVYVSGQTNGVQGLVRLEGTGGDELATSETNIMMTDSDAVRSLGERILSGAQPQPTISSISTWCDGDVVPLFEVGDFVRIVVDGENTQGIVNAVSINCTLNDDVMEVGQTLTIGEDTNNQYELFKELLPSNPLSIVTILQALDGKSRVQHIDGATQVVRGTGIVGGSYYLKDGQLLNATSNVPSIADVVI